MALLEIRCLCKAFDHVVLDRLDLDVAAGEFFVVVGPSGIGKTTLLRCVAGLETPQAGTIRVRGQDVSGLPPYRRNVALTFESYALYPHLTVFENIASPLRARRLAAAEIRRKVGEVARLLRIEHILDHRPGEISGGQKQRTALGRTLVRDPDVFLLDEPISHLDAKIRHELREQFHHLEELRRTATLYVTHDYAEALSLGDRIGVMGPGGLVQIGTPEEVFERPNSLFVARHLGQPTINLLPAELRREGDRTTLLLEGTELRLTLTGAQTAALSNRAGGRVVLGVRPHHIGLADGAVTGEDGTVLDARVELYEALGAKGVLLAELGPFRLNVLTAPEARFRSGEAVRLAFDRGAFLFFCPERGDNLIG